MMKCTKCERSLIPKPASIPTAIICYTAGPTNADKPDEQIVTEWHCPRHGLIFSPGGGICASVRFVGGPLDSQVLVVGDAGIFYFWEQEIGDTREYHKYERTPIREYPTVYKYVGRDRTENLT